MRIFFFLVIFTFKPTPKITQNNLKVIFDLPDDNGLFQQQRRTVIVEEVERCHNHTGSCAARCPVTQVRCQNMLKPKILPPHPNQKDEKISRNFDAFAFTSSFLLHPARNIHTCIRHCRFHIRPLVCPSDNSYVS